MGFWNQTNQRTKTYQKTRIQMWAAEHPLLFWALLGLGRAATFLCWTAPTALVRAAKAKTAPAEGEAATVTAIGTARRAKGQA
jgi:hypothetical protein